MSTAVDSTREALTALSLAKAARPGEGPLLSQAILDLEKAATALVAECEAPPKAPVELVPTDAMVDAVARSFAGLSERLWAEALEDSSSIMIATVKYYRDHARDALEAVGRLTITTPRVEIGGKDQS